MRNFCFLAGLPRSGSTLLGTLLCQRDNIHVSATSSLIDTLGAAAAAWENSPQCRSGDVTIDALFPMLRSMVEAHYKDIDKIVIDKSRGWPAPQIMSSMGKAFGSKPKIIATVRPIAECLASFMKIAKFDGAPRDFVEQSQLAKHLFVSYATLKAGYEAEPKNFLFVTYADLVADPQRECDRVADFLAMPRFQHCFTGLTNPVPENDAKTWGIPDLHFVRPTIAAEDTNPRGRLGDKLFAFYQGGEFWTGKPEPKPKKNIIDLQLAASLRGNFKRGWELAQCADDNDDRAMFNKGWYVLRQGKLKEGIRLMDRGRHERVFGNPPPSSQPIWDGRKLNNDLVLLNCEGGIGDQICNARFARDIAARGGRVVLSCTAELAPLLAQISGVSGVIQQQAAGGAYHQWWVPSMSSPAILDMEYADLNGSPYLPCPQLSNNKFRVGIRWAGNPKFEHEQHRCFPHDWMFELPGDLVSLQDNWNKPIPDHVAKPTLDSWQKTASEIAKCDLIVSSCTAVAHLAAAMGKPTWIVVPILPYYIWSLPGDTSPWYDTVRLFRQKKYGDWSHPMQAIMTALTKMEAVCHGNG